MATQRKTDRPTRPRGKIENGRGPVTADWHDPKARSMQPRGIPPELHEQMLTFRAARGLNAGQFLINLWYLREQLIDRGDAKDLALLEALHLAPLTVR